MRKTYYAQFHKVNKNTNRFLEKMQQTPVCLTLE